MSRPYHYIAIDLGAESGRVMLATLKEEKLSLQEVLRFPNGPINQNGTLRWDIDSLFGEIKKGIKQTLQLEKDIQSIGVDTWGVDFGLLDSNGQLLENPYHYRDPRTTGIIEQAGRILPTRDIYLNTGIQLLPFNTLFQLIAYKQQQPEVLQKASSLLFMPNLFMYLLSGDICAEYTIASTSQIMDMNIGTWSDVIFETFDLPREIFPKVVPAGTKIGVLSRKLCEELGCNQIPIIAVGTHDTASAVAAVPADYNKNWAYLSSGTWSLMGIEVSKPIIDQSSFDLSFTNEGGVENTIRLLKNIMGLWLIQQCRTEWAGQGKKLDYSELTQMASQAKPFQACIDPDFEEFMTHGNMPEKINRYLVSTGQSEIHDKGQLSRVILESLAVRYRQTLGHLEKLSGSPVDVLHLVGGGTRNELLNQFTADSTGKKVVTGPVEATVLGNVLIQAKAGGQIKSLAHGRKIVAESVSLKEYKPVQTEQWDSFEGKFSQL
ncbi:MAG: rhamnulokinase [Planctomycetota bacterium]|jgi:rhamnulokinase